MRGHEELIKRGYVDSKRPKKILPEQFGRVYGKIELGETTFGVLAKYLDLTLDEAEVFVPEIWKPPTNVNNSKPDVLIIKDRTVFCVCEHKSPGELKAKRKQQEAIEQLQYYVLATSAAVGLLTDGSNNFWIHNLDAKRKAEIKVIEYSGSLYTEEISPKILSNLLERIDPQSDSLTDPSRLDPSHVARSVWQSVYVATRETPERCFQTFVELFTYKLLSDWGILPKNMTISELAIDSSVFKRNFGKLQILYYIENVRTHVKNHLFPPIAVPDKLDDVRLAGSDFILTRRLFLNSDATSFEQKGATSVIDGHAFQKSPEPHNDAFVTIIKKLNQLENVKSLDPGFKSRVYEQFLRRDPNTTKVSGKYFTPRNVVRAIIQMADLSKLPPGSIICDPACGVGGFITEAYLALESTNSKIVVEDRGKIDVKYKFIGLDCEYDIICLAKANFLLHTIEFYNSLSSLGREIYQKFLGDMFVWCHKDTELGSLYHPSIEKFDIVMTNPPYIVSGTGSVTRKIKNDPLLSKQFISGGSGLESRFVNYIVNSLKPGGRGFIVLPKSMFARTESGLKSFLRDHCIIDGLIYLPKGSFYTTPVETYVLSVTKKHHINQTQSEPVFAYLIAEIGETRDVKRDPERNDLIEMASQFRIFKANKFSYNPNGNPQCKIIPFNEFTPKNRWDVDRYWSIEEKRTLGIIDREQVWTFPKK